MARAAGPVSAAEFRGCLRLHAAGVVVVTAAGDDGPAGFTATSFTAASLDPPLVSFYVDRRSGTWPVIRRAGRFGVNVLASGQHGLAHAFSRRGIDRFEAVDWRPGPHGVPVLAGARAWLACAVHLASPVGDHFLVVGLVVHASAGGGAPLVYQDGRYGSVTRVVPGPSANGAGLVEPAQRG